MTARAFIAVALAIAAVAAVIAYATRGEDTMTASALFGCIDRADTGPFTRSTDADDLDLIAEDAGAGAMELHSDRQDITLVVERSADDAESTGKQYELFADAFSAGGHVEQHGNVVVVFSKSPASLEREFVDGCVP